MNIINKFLNTYSYKFPKGYPDLTSVDDVQLINEILIGLNIENFDLKKRLSLLQEVKSRFPKINDSFVLNEDLGQFKAGDTIKINNMVINDNEVDIIFENEEKIVDNFIFDINDKFI